MTELELEKILKMYIIDNDNCFSKKVQSILIMYKDSGGQQEIAKRLVETMATEFAENETLQDSAYDILDIVTGWCSCDMKVWD